MTCRRHLLIAAIVGFLASGCSSVDRSRNLGDPAVPGHVLAEQVCSNCHGLDGNSESPAFPSLAGQQALYLTNQLSNFRAHHRIDPAGSEYMWGLSHRLTDAQIADIAAYYARQTPRRSHDRMANPKLLAEGKAIFESGVPEEKVIACMACHGPKAEGIEAFPRLAGQHSDYIIKQLNVFQNTQGRPGTPMEFVVHPLTGANKSAVAAYLQSLPN